MKKTIILIVIMLISVSYVASQDNDVLFKAKLNEYSNTGLAEDIKFGKSNNVIIKMYTDDDDVGRLIISNEYDDRFTLLGRSEESTDYDDRIEADIKHDLFRAYDKDGVECFILISVVKDDDKYYTEDCIFRIRVSYNNLLYGYYCKIIQL